MDLPRLVALTPGDLERGRGDAFLRELERALAAGLPGILVREPRLADRAFLELFAAIREACERSDVPWVALHDRAHLARGLGAPVLHLGFRSLAPAQIRSWVGDGILLGLSTHAHDDPGSWRAVDYLFHGPLRDTPSKRGRVAPVGLEGLARAAAATDRPLLALGGVRPADVEPALAAGAWGVAVLSGIFATSDPGAATAEYLSALGGAR